MSQDDDTSDDAFVSDLAPVTGVLRSHYLQPPSDELAERHLARMMAAVTADGVIDLDTIDLRPPRRVRRAVVASLVGASVLSISGLAAAGVLPAPVQSRVAAMVQPLGLQLPGGVDAPGQSEDAPGHGGDSPGQSEDAPGRGGENPGNSEQAPGQGGENPGKSDQAPGQGGQNPGNPGAPPTVQTTTTAAKTPPSNAGNGGGNGKGQEKP